MADQERHPAKPKAQKEESGLMRNGGHGSGGSENSDPLGLFSIFLARARFVIFINRLERKEGAGDHCHHCRAAQSSIAGKS